VGAAVTEADAARTNAVLIQRFYAALDRHDAEAMIACYGPGARFSDPVFPALDANGVRAMWRMLCVRGKDLRVAVSNVEADAASGRARWVATYTYSPTGRYVVNRIRASFAFRDGLIERHVDRFSLWRWAAMALGAKGVLLGWLPQARSAIRAQAEKALEAYSRSLAS
jgi:ketosteroid isomerase-like protein